MQKTCTIGKLIVSLQRNQEVKVSFYELFYFAYSRKAFWL